MKQYKFSILFDFQFFSKDWKGQMRITTSRSIIRLKNINSVLSTANYFLLIDSFNYQQKNFNVPCILCNGAANSNSINIYI